MSETEKEDAGSLASLFDYPVTPHPPDDEIVAWLAYLAGVDVAEMQADVEHGGPLAVTVARLMGFQKFRPVSPPPPKKRGAPEDFGRDHLINRVVSEAMDRGLSRAEAIKAAPRKLLTLGVHNRHSPPAPLTEASIRRALRRYPRIWLDPPENASGH